MDNLNEPFMTTPKIPSNFVISGHISLGILVASLINAGMTYQQFQALKDESSKNGQLVATIRENQIKGLAEVDKLKEASTAHEARLVIVERYIIDANKFDRRR